MKNLLKPITSFPDVEKEFENQLGVIVEDVEFATANTDVTITHNLGYTPNYYEDIKCNTYGRFKFVSSDNEDIVLQCDTNSTTATIRVW